jgi:hypothetical protein
MPKATPVCASLVDGVANVRAATARRPVESKPPAVSRSATK